MSRGWAKASASRLQMTLSCAVLCHIVSLQYLSRSSLHRLAGFPCRLFLSYGLQAVTRVARGPSVVFEAVNMPCPGPFHFSQRKRKRGDVLYTTMMTLMLRIVCECGATSSCPISHLTRVLPNLMVIFCLMTPNIKKSSHFSLFQCLFISTTSL